MVGCIGGHRIHEDTEGRLCCPCGWAASVICRPASLFEHHLQDGPCHSCDNMLSQPRSLAPRNNDPEDPTGLMETVSCPSSLKGLTGRCGVIWGLCPPNARITLRIDCHSGFGHTDQMCLDGFEKVETVGHQPRTVAPLTASNLASYHHSLADSSDGFLGSPGSHAHRACWPGC